MLGRIGGQLAAPPPARPPELARSCVRQLAPFATNRQRPLGVAAESGARQSTFGEHNAIAVVILAALLRAHCADGISDFCSGQ